MRQITKRLLQLPPLPPWHSLVRPSVGPSVGPSVRPPCISPSFPLNCSSVSHSICPSSLPDHLSVRSGGLWRTVLPSFANCALVTLCNLGDLQLSSSSCRH